MGDTEKFIVSAVLLGVIAAEARDLPAMIEKWKDADEPVRSGILLRWMVIAALTLGVLSLALARKVQPNNAVK